MQVHIHIGPEPISLQPDAFLARIEVGAIAEFHGLIRGEEQGLPIAGILYEAYQPMAEREISRIIADLALIHPVLGVRVIHRLGLVPVGEAAIYVAVAARHRAEAFSLLAGFMDRLKQDVPIWKIDALPAASEN